MKSWLSVMVLLLHLARVERQRMQFLISLLMIEPIALYWGFGFGMGNMISGVGSRSYPEYLYPGFICFSAIIFSFLESAWGTHRRWHHSLLLKQIKYSPISPNDVVLTELTWCGIYGCLASWSVALIGYILGFSSWWMLPWILIVSMVFSSAGSALGMGLVVLFQRGSLFTLLTSLLVFPLAFISGIFFPLSQVPWALRWIGPFFPPYHTTQLMQALVWSQWNWFHLFNFAYLAMFIFIIYRFVFPRAAAMVREFTLRAD